ncbi:hypothetical protein C8J57DRAFT_1322956 [Mycena rebaudengoi]|nr:hypothetical protein C8J57DRAFT_1322956 [Mycena rebaudengoi]
MPFPPRLDSLGRTASMDSRPSRPPLYVHTPPVTPLYLKSRANDGNTVVPEKDKKLRPLPKAPIEPVTQPARPARRRRLSGGSFVNPPPAKTRFYICNPGTSSPISPPAYQHSFQHFPSPLPVNIIPPTPLPPTAPEMVISSPHLSTCWGRSRCGSEPFFVESPTEMPETMCAPAKRHRRLGASVGSIPPELLAELRDIGERTAPTSEFKVLAEPEDDIDSDSDSSSSDEDDDDHEDYDWILDGHHVFADSFSELLRSL